MAIIKCRECKAKISNRASACTKCGNPVSEEDKKAREAPKITKTTAIIIGCVAFVITFSLIHNSSTPTEETQEEKIAGTHLAMRGVCKNAIRDRLTDADADFSDARSAAFLEDKKTGITKVQFFVKAKNAYGALVKNLYQCAVIHVKTKDGESGLKVIAVSRIQ